MCSAREGSNLLVLMLHGGNTFAPSPINVLYRILDLSNQTSLDVGVPVMVCVHPQYWHRTSGCQIKYKRVQQSEKINPSVVTVGRTFFQTLVALLSTAYTYLMGLAKCVGSAPESLNLSVLALHKSNSRSVQANLI